MVKQLLTELNTGLAEKLLEGYFTDGISDRTVVNDGRLTAEATFNMAIQTVVARIQLSAYEPEASIKALQFYLQ